MSRTDIIKYFLLPALWLLAHTSLSQTNTKALRKAFIKTDTICDCNGIFELKPEQMHLSAFPEAVRLVDSIRQVQRSSWRKVFYEDSTKYYELNYYPTTTKLKIYIYMYYKHINTTHYLAYDKNYRLFATGNSFNLMSVGTSMEFDSTGKLKNREELNYVVTRQQKRVNRRYPICWREAYELAKTYAGITKTEPHHAMTRSMFHPGNWVVAFGDDHTMIYLVNARNGKVKE